MPEETMRFTATLDLSQLQAQLAEARSTINNQLQDVFSGVGSVGADLIGGFANAVSGGGGGGGYQQAYTQGVMMTPQAYEAAMSPYLPAYPSGQAGPAIHSLAQPMAPAYAATSGLAYDQNMQAVAANARTSYFADKRLPFQVAKFGLSTTLGVIGGALGTAIPIPGVGTIAGYMAGEWVGEKLVGGVEDMLFDKRKWADYLDVRSKLDQGITVGMGNFGSGALGGVDPRISAQVAKGIMQRAKETRHFDTRSLGDLAAMAGEAGLLTGAMAGAGDVDEAAESISKRLIGIEKRVKRIKTVLGVDDQTAIQGIVSGIEAGFSEDEAAIRFQQKGFYARQAGLSRGQADAATDIGRQVFSSMALSGALGYEASRESMILARAMMDSGAVSREAAIRGGGVVGLTAGMVSEQARFLQGGTGQLLQLSGVGNAGAMRDYVMTGQVTQQNLAQEVMRNVKSPYDLMMVTHQAQKNQKNIPEEYLAWAPAREHLSNFRRAFPNKPADRAGFEAFLNMQGLSGSEAEVMSGMMERLQTEPEKVQQEVGESVRRTSHMESALLVDDAIMEDNFNRRRELLENVGTIGANIATLGLYTGVKKAKVWAFGAPGDEAKLDKRQMDAYDAYLAKMDTARNAPISVQRRLREEALDESLATRRANQVAEGGALTKAKNWVAGWTVDAFADWMDSSRLATEGIQKWAVDYQLGTKRQNAEDTAAANEVAWQESLPVDADAGSALRAIHDVLVVIAQNTQS